MINRNRLAVAEMEPSRRVLAAVSLSPKQPLISGWVWALGAAFAAGVWCAELVQAAVG